MNVKLLDLRGKIVSNRMKKKEILEDKRRRRRKTMIEIGEEIRIEEVKLIMEIVVGIRIIIIIIIIKVRFVMVLVN